MPPPPALPWSVPSAVPSASEWWSTSTTRSGASRARSCATSRAGSPSGSACPRAPPRSSAGWSAWSGGSSGRKRPPSRAAPSSAEIVGDLLVHRSHVARPRHVRALGEVNFLRYPQCLEGVGTGRHARQELIATGGDQEDGLAVTAEVGGEERSGRAMPPERGVADDEIKVGNIVIAERSRQRLRDAPHAAAVRHVAVGDPRQEEGEVQPEVR